MNSLMDITHSSLHGVGTARRVAGVGIISTEATNVIVDSRWILILMIILIVADFHFGMSESKKRYIEAEKEGDKVRMDYFKWHPSRAWRRTFNKLADYLVIMLVCQVVGMAILAPIGVDYFYGPWAGGVIACICEIFSIFGHFFYLRGVKVEKRNLIGFVKALVVAFAKKKNEDAGEAIEEALNQTENGNKRN